MKECKACGYEIEDNQTLCEQCKLDPPLAMEDMEVGDMIIGDNYESRIIRGER